MFCGRLVARESKEKQEAQTASNATFMTYATEATIKINKNCVFQRSASHQVRLFMSKPSNPAPMPLDDAASILQVNDYYPATPEMPQQLSLAYLSELFAILFTLSALLAFDLSQAKKAGSELCFSRTSIRILSR
jgi:hypothetical protein